uniref:N-acetylglucosaminyl-phosphatidylinositol n=1 Tax=Solanum tuberosum TaxID=4113 RepID=M1AVX7_SOLTU
MVEELGMSPLMVLGNPYLELAFWDELEPKSISICGFTYGRIYDKKVAGSWFGVQF